METILKNFMRPSSNFQKKDKMEKIKIGKIQVIMGIVMIIIGILGIIATSIYYKQSMKNNAETLRTEISDLNFEYQKGNMTETIMTADASNIWNRNEILNEHALTTSIILFSSLVLLIIISILFITQGAINKKR